MSISVYECLSAILWVICLEWLWCLWLRRDLNTRPRAYEVLSHSKKPLYLKGFRVSIFRLPSCCLSVGVSLIILQFFPRPNRFWRGKGYIPKSIILIGRLNRYQA